MCRKRTILSVHTYDGRFYWRCPTHGWSEWACEQESMNYEQRGESVEAELLCEFIPSMEAQNVQGSEDAIKKPSEEHVQARQQSKCAKEMPKNARKERPQNASKAKVQAVEDKYSRIRQLICLNLGVLDRKSVV